MTKFWVGGYGADMDGDAAGIGLIEGDEGREPTTLAYRGTTVAVASPSWLASHPTLDVVYAALEGSGTVQAFVRDGESSLAPVGGAVDAGSGVCHLAVAPNGEYLVASCYGDGRVVRIGLDAGGRLGATKIADAATDPYGADAVEGALGADTSVDLAALLATASPGTARTSHAHAAAFLPDGRIATTDLGFDTVRIWRTSTDPSSGAAGLVADHDVVLPHGTGPRHMVVHPSGHLHVVTEYSCEVFTLAAGPSGHWALASATTVSPVAQTGGDYPSELSRSRDGETLYAGVRGSNTIAALRVRGDGSKVEPFALAESGVDWPRHHLVHDGALLVAGQRSDQISVLDLDERSGAPRGIRHRTAAPSPTSILFAH